MTVIIAFGVLWFGTLGLVSLSELWRIYFGSPLSKQSRNNKSQLHRSVVPSSVTASNPHVGANAAIEDSLDLYLSEFFSSAFSETSQASKVITELVSKHIYFSVFTKEVGVRKWIGAFELLTNLTINMFLLAIFYDIEFPVDNGSCEANLTESTCLLKKSLFNRSKPMCVWGDHGGNDANSSCYWVSPKFDPSTVVAISVVVVFISGPIYMIVSTIINEVLMAPTVTDVKESYTSLQNRRASAVSMVERRQSTVADSSRSEMKRARAGGAPPPAPKLFSKHNFMNDEFHNICVKAQRLSKPMVQRHSKCNQIEMAKYRSFDNFLRDLHHCDETLRRQSKRELERFRATWKNVLDFVPHEEVIGEHNYLSEELQAVVSEADAYVAKLKSQPAAHIGVQILELFVKDLLGRESREATIFSQQVHPLRSKMVMSWGMKCIALSVLILLNLYFIWSCMLYGRDKGIRWQRGWLIASFINLLVDIFIKQVNIALVIYYFVPNLIANRTKFIRETVSKALSRLYEPESESGASDVPNSNTSELLINPQLLNKHSKKESFSASSYLFVSAHVARAFPDLLESSIALQYQSYNVSKEQRSKWQGAVAGNRYTFAVGRGVIIRQIGQVVRGLWCSNSIETESRRELGCLPTIGIWLTSLLLMFGSQNHMVQTIVIMTLNPLLVACMAFIGVAIIRTTYYGIPIGLIIVVTALVVGYAFYRYSTRHVPDSEADVEVVNPADSKALPASDEIEINHGKRSRSSGSSSKSHDGDEIFRQRAQSDHIVEEKPRAAFSFGIQSDPAFATPANPEAVPNILTSVGIDVYAITSVRQPQPPVSSIPLSSGAEGTGVSLGQCSFRGTVPIETIYEENSVSESESRSSKQSRANDIAIRQKMSNSRVVDDYVGCSSSVSDLSGVSSGSTYVDALGYGNPNVVVGKISSEGKYQTTAVVHDETAIASASAGLSARIAAESKRNTDIADADVDLRSIDSRISFPSTISFDSESNKPDECT